MGIDDESSHPGLCSEVAGGVTRNMVCLFREPDAGNPPVRFDEREEETELSQTGLRRRGESSANCHREATVTAPLLDSTHFLSFEKGGVCDQKQERAQRACGIVVFPETDARIDNHPGSRPISITTSYSGRSGQRSRT